ncbi:hypothetical protein ACIP2X_09520 [Streptomyces sp. NPDC089424]|uniref:WapI family immunity protein n=1 Tax=Streptomyces sp. NPDC089424 TaxID=3365917 RepID=UPI0037F75A70
MRLTDSAGDFGIRPLGYEYPVARGNRWDDNWLVIAGECKTPEVSWSFTDPSLLVDEAHEVSRWLRAVASEERPDAQPDEDGKFVPDLIFIEPVIAFSQVRWRDGRGVLRVHLSLEAAPPPAQDAEGLELYQYVIEIESDRAAVLRAAATWDRYLVQFPMR